MTLMTRKEFLDAVSKATGRKPATISQCLYTHGFLAAEYELVGHIQRPRFLAAQVEDACDLVLRRKRGA